MIREHFSTLRSIPFLIVACSMIPGCGDVAPPSGPASTGPPATDLVGAQIQSIAARGAGTWYGDVSGRAIVSGALGRRAVPSSLLLMQFDDYSNDGRITLNGSVSYVEQDGSAHIAGELQVRVHVALSQPLDDPQTSLQDLQLYVQLERTAQPPVSDTGQQPYECITLTDPRNDSDMAADVRARIGQHLLAMAARGSGSHAGNDDGLALQSLQRQWQAAEAVERTSYSLELTGYRQGTLTYDGRLDAQIHTGEAGATARFAGQLTVSGGASGRVTMCERLGNAMVRAALAAEDREEEVATKGG